MDVVATIHGGGVSAQAGALRHGISRALHRGRPEPPRRAQAPRLPHARPAREGAQEGRPQEGPQAAAVLQALARAAWPRKLFGTDGVRGVAGEFLTAELALALARAATARRRRVERPRRSLVIRDTRESGEMLEAALAAGVAAAGGEALLGGVLPTPGAPLLIAPLRLRPRRRDLRLAQPVPRQRHQVLRRATASSSSDDDRGRDRGGARARRRPTPSQHRPRPPRSHGALEDYLRELHERFDGLDLTGRRILLDCANGATYRAAPGDLPPPRRRGRRRSPPSPTAATSTPAAARPTSSALAERDARGRPRRRLRLRRRRRPRAGRRPRRRGRRRRRADRARRAAPARRRPPARRRRRRDGDDQLRLPHRDGASAGIEVATTPVGDRYVLEALRAARLGARRRAVRPHHRHGLRALRRRHRRRAAHARGARRRATSPTATRWRSCRRGSSTCASRDRAALDGAARRSREAVEREAAALEGRGRVLVRPSGTEPLVRVMVEAPTAEEADAVVRAARRGGQAALE